LNTVLELLELFDITPDAEQVVFFEKNVGNRNRHTPTFTDDFENVNFQFFDQRRICNSEADGFSIAQKHDVREVIVHPVFLRQVRVRFPRRYKSDSEKNHINDADAKKYKPHFRELKHA